MEKTDKSAEDYWFDFSNHDTQMITEASFKAAIRACQKDSAAQQLSEYKEVIKELLPVAESFDYNGFNAYQELIDRAKKLIEK